MKDKIRVEKAGLKGKSHGARRDAFSRHPRAEQPGSDAPSTRGAGRAGLGAFGGDTAASCGRVARAVASPRVPGFAFVGGMGGHAPASDDFIVILADALAGKNALLPATAPLLAAARPMRAAVTPRPAPDTARLAMDMQREADIVDVRCGWNGRRALEAGPKPQNPACEMGRDVSKPNRGRYQPSWARFLFFFWRGAPSHVRSFSLFSFASKNSPIPPLSRKIRVRPRVQWETVSIARREAFVCSRWRSRK